MKGTASADVIINFKPLATRQFPRIMLDIVMLVLAVVHLLLLLFDSTYFNFRNLYFYYLPGVVRAYDPVKGVSPHAFTQEYLALASEYFSSCQQSGQVDPTLRQRLIERSDQMIDENPFERAQQTGQLELAKEQMRRFTGVSSSSKKAFRVFWNQNCTRLEERQRFFSRRIAHYLRTNFWRQIDTNGQPVDWFLSVDLGFILIFLLEFLISWAVAIRRFGSDQKILFPLYHWYDLLSCIPLRELRYLRLLRIFAIYVRLIQSEIIQIRAHPLYRRFARYQTMIMEEISDQVAINILTNIQAKTRLGTNREMLEETLRSYRGEIQEVILLNLQRFRIPTFHTKQAELSALIARLLWESIRHNSDYKALKQIPLVSGMLDQAVNPAKLERMVAESLETFLSELDAEFKSAAMTDFLNTLLSDILDEVLQILEDERIQVLLEDLNLKILEELKKSSTAKTWKTPIRGRTGDLKPEA